MKTHLIELGLLHKRPEISRDTFSGKRAIVRIRTMETDAGLATLFDATIFKPKAPAGADPVIVNGQVADEIEGRTGDEDWTLIKGLWTRCHANGNRLWCQHMPLASWWVGEPVPMMMQGLERDPLRVHPYEHPHGLLGRHCPSCGYTIGDPPTAHPLDADDEAALRDLLRRRVPDDEGEH